MDDRFKTLINAKQLLPHIYDEHWLVVDCTYYLQFPDQGYSEYLKSHIPNALYANLNNNLTGQTSPISGRHPLPEDEDFKVFLEKLGFHPDLQVVVYDSSGGTMAAARLWWLLNYYGYQNVALLDGGFLNWLWLEYPVSSQISHRKKTKLELKATSSMVIDAQNIRGISRDKDYRILDARANNRYLGLEETIDPIAGHIPGAISAPVTDFLDEDMNFKSRDEIRTMLGRFLGGTLPQNMIYYCGSGVTAALGIFVLSYAGYGMARLYPGSWSEWIKIPWVEIAVHK